MPFLRTIKVALENSAISKAERWNKVRRGLERTFTAFVNSININFGLGSYGSAQIDLSKFMDILKIDGFAVINGERIHYHEHVTDYLAHALSKLRDENPNSRVSDRVATEFLTGSTIKICEIYIRSVTANFFHKSVVS